MVCLMRCRQSILTLVHIRRAHHLFPIRAYLPQLVATLEDTDGNVRECARQSVVELFTGPGVTDAARADLKKEMTKKSVRKNIVDHVLAKLVAGGTGGGVQSDGSENGDAGPGPGGKKEYIPPSLALQGRKPTGGLGASTGSGGMPRTVSQGNVKELSRPASRTAMVSPPLPPTPIDNAGNDVHPVYVSLTYFCASYNLSDP
jgi:CLIP-associating protein 1/2